jgi:hypothetical protein
MTDPPSQSRLSFGPRLFVMTPIVLLLAIANCTVAHKPNLVAHKPNKADLVATLTSRLREEKFEQLYDDTWENVRLNVTKQKFVERMKIAVGKMKEIDQDLNFQKDISEEMLLKSDSGRFVSAHKLQKDGKSVLVFFFWDENGGFSDLGVSPDEGTSDEYAVYGVSYKHLYRGNQLVE